ncbi:hypothetical protein DICPUDRAFT_36352 [Dictyostelium purpureum]|uniref:peptidylprolyl isomerase n=1 Tax=Dictyostelium purpureum TaxID=5786 RepID=F0ZQY9_DICPU|nr:uncharacterized protein DICPUDRAFT_36352 [Dictyostelium purpureum]EGC33664.1 hypothetical protein DICPUDRAFT_36352 [Dictyostelium purpureum]|eukprot:XP_003289834.1 hypothetical protein DICPUDRAFT_36352 [Dictyostelium purpureum]
MNKIIIALLFLITLSFVFAQDQEQTPQIKLIETNVQECKGKKANIGDTVSVKYTGKLEDGTVFDSSELHGGIPFNFTIGERKVIPGMEIGTFGICEGETRTFFIPYQYAYGEEAVGTIPARSNLIFTVEAVSIELAPPLPLHQRIIPSKSTIGAFVFVAAFIFLVKFILKRYPDEMNSKKTTTVGKPKKSKSKSN